MTEQIERDIVEHGPYLIDGSTGEIVGLIPERAEFHVTDLASAEWVLEKLADEEAAMAALKARQATFTKNVESMILDHERRATWLLGRFLPELQAWTEKELQGKKSRTLKTVWGRLSFRKRPARVSIEDETRALDWCSVNVPQAVKVKESVLVSEIPADITSNWLELGSAAPGFVVVPEEDRFSISTGVA